MKLYRNIIILTLIIALLGAGYWFVYKYEPKEEVEDSPSHNYTTLFKTERENILELNITLPDESYLVSKDGTKWVVNNDKTIAVSQSKLDTLMYEAAAISAKELVDENPADLSVYGLLSPERKAVIKTKDGKETAFLAGSKTVDGEYYFVMIEGENKVYLKSITSVESLMKSLYDLRDSVLYSVSEEDLSKITIKKTGNDEIVLETENVGTNEEPMYEWKIKAPLKGEVENYTLSEDVIAKILSISHDMPAKGKTEAECGLLSPYAVYSVTADDEKYVVTIGNLDGEYRYVKVSGNDGIYLVKNDKLTFVDVQYSKLMMKLIHLENITDVNGVTIKRAGEEYVLKHTGSEENDTYTINDKPVNEKNYKKAYQAVLSVALDDFVTSDVTGKAEVTITYDRKDGKRSEVTFVSCDERNYVVKVNGEGNLTIKKKKIDAIFEKLAEIYNP